MHSSTETAVSRRISAVVCTPFSSIVALCGFLSMMQKRFALRD